MHMSYPTFQRLLGLKLALHRALHTEPPTGRKRLNRAIEVLDTRLSGCEEYRNYLRRYAHTMGKVG